MTLVRLVALAALAFAAAQAYKVGTGIYDVTGTAAQGSLPSAHAVFLILRFQRA